MFKYIYTSLRYESNKLIIYVLFFFVSLIPTILTRFVGEIENIIASMQIVLWDSNKLLKQYQIAKLFKMICEKGADFVRHCTPLRKQ